MPYRRDKLWTLHTYKYLWTLPSVAVADNCTCNILSYSTLPKATTFYVTLSSRCQLPKSVRNTHWMMCNFDANTPKEQCRRRLSALNRVIAFEITGLVKIKILWKSKILDPAPITRTDALWINIRIQNRLHNVHVPQSSFWNPVVFLLFAYKRWKILSRHRSILFEER